MSAELSIIIVSWNTREILEATLSRLPAATEGLDWEVLVVDNASSDGSAEMVAKDFPNIELIRNTTNEGFGRACNRGLEASSGRWLLMLNADTALTKSTLDSMIEFMQQHPDAGVCGPRLNRADGQPQAFAFGGDPTLWYLLKRNWNRVLFRRPLHDWAEPETRCVDWVTGACMLVRKEAAEKVGGFDPKIFLYFEDNDWCLRMRKAGWHVYHFPRVSITHGGGRSASQNPDGPRHYRKSLAYFHAKHYGVLSCLILTGCLFVDGVFRRIGKAFARRPQ